MATQELFTVEQAAAELELTKGRIRQLLRAFRDEGEQVGQRFGRDWLLTKDDIIRLRNRPDRRRRDFFQN